MTPSKFTADTIFIPFRIIRLAKPNLQLNFQAVPKFHQGTEIINLTFGADESQDKSVVRIIANRTSKHATLHVVIQPATYGKTFTASSHMFHTRAYLKNTHPKKLAPMNNVASPIAASRSKGRGPVPTAGGLTSPPQQKC